MYSELYSLAPSINVGNRKEGTYTNMTSSNMCRLAHNMFTCLSPSLRRVLFQLGNKASNHLVTTKYCRERGCYFSRAYDFAKVYSATTNVHSATVMAKTFSCRVMAFGFTEMAKSAARIEAKKLSTGSKTFSGSQQKLESQSPVTEELQLQRTKSLANQSTENKSQGSQTESQVKMGSESGGLSKRAKCRKWRKWKEAMRILESQSDKSNPEGRKKQSQGRQSESQVKMDSESGGFSVISTCTKQVEWNEPMKMFEAHSKRQITLSNEQMTVLSAVSRGESVFVTGSAGTGKSYLLNFVVKILKKLHGPDSVFVTASTGIAACHLNGMTLHSFAGAPPFAVSEQRLLAVIEKKDKNVKRWEKAKALVIDEISMIDGEFFDQMNYVANELRQPLQGEGVWGGLQLVVTGDFFQLPPVTPKNQDKFFAFEADCWNECFDKQIELTHFYRQSDRELVEMLQEIRKGLWDSKTLAKLNNRIGPSVDESVTRLYPRNDDVRRVNDERLNSLGQEIITFSAKDKGEEYEKRKLKTGIAPDQIGLCIGAQVMLIKNIGTEIGLVNGATGQIVDFVRDETQSRAISPTGLWPKVRFRCGVERIITSESWDVYEGEVKVASRTQVPLILAWAITVHKCQRMTLEKLETDLSSAYDYGMVYVALSRVKKLDGLRLTGFKPSKIKAHPKVLDVYQKLTSTGGYLDDTEKKRIL